MTLDSSLKFWELVSEIGFVAVLLGVVGEGCEIYAKLFKKEHFKKFERRYEIASAICWVVLVVGLSVEFWGSHKAMAIGDAMNAALTSDAAKLEKEAAEARLEVARLTTPRWEKFDHKSFREAIRDKPKIRVELIYPLDDVDAFWFANSAKAALQEEGWTVSGPRPLKLEDVNLRGTDPDAPLQVRAGLGMGGLTFVSRTLAEGPLDDSTRALNIAFTVCRRGLGVKQTSSIFSGQIDPNMPDGTVKIIIGSKYREW